MALSVNKDYEYYFVGGMPGILTVSTGLDDLRTTFSATLPIIT